MSVTEQALPRWDMTPIYPGIDSAEFDNDFGAMVSAIEELYDLLDLDDIEKREPPLSVEEQVRLFETVLDRYSAIVEKLTTLESYLTGFVMIDSRNDLAQAKMSELENETLLLSQFETRLTRWIGTLDVAALIARSEIAHRHAFLLEQTQIKASHLMSQDEEDLALALSLTGGSAWSSMYDSLTSQLLVPIEIDGQQQELPMSVVRNMSIDPVREKRRRAYNAERAGWERITVALAAALNSINGETNTLNEKRGWSSSLDAALFGNSIDRQTLDAMFQAAHESLPDFRRYLRVKARALDLPVLAWYDLYAPVGRSDRSWDFPEATEFIVEEFGTFSKHLGDLATIALRDRWIDAEPREGKTDGAFCIPMRGQESRVLVNFTPSYDGMSTLAHELGHGYHNYNLASRPPLLRDAPSTLAETASIFCQTLVREAALARVNESEQLAIISESLQESNTLVANVLARFLFEQRLFERRQERELSVDELCALTLESERETFGDAVDAEFLQPYAWASIPHFYFAGDPYYNFPYMFGLLFALGLYARYQKDPEGFRTGYDELLASTGEADAATLCARFGIDIRQPDFWRESLDIIRTDIDRFEALVNAGAASDNGKQPSRA